MPVAMGRGPLVGAQRRPAKRRTGRRYAWPHRLRHSSFRSIPTSRAGEIRACQNRSDSMAARAASLPTMPSGGSLRSKVQPDRPTSSSLSPRQQGELGGRPYLCPRTPLPGEWRKSLLDASVRGRPAEPPIQKHGWIRNRAARRTGELTGVSLCHGLKR